MMIILHGKSERSGFAEAAEERKRRLRALRAPSRLVAVASAVSEICCTNNRWAILSGRVDRWEQLVEQLQWHQGMLGNKKPGRHKRWFQVLNLLIYGFV